MQEGYPGNWADLRSIRTAVVSLSCRLESSGELYKSSDACVPAPTYCDLIGLGWNLGTDAFKSSPDHICSRNEDHRLGVLC